VNRQCKGEEKGKRRKKKKKRQDIKQTPHKKKKSKGTWQKKRKHPLRTKKKSQHKKKSTYVSSTQVISPERKRKMKYVKVGGMKVEKTSPVPKSARGRRQYDTLAVCALSLTEVPPLRNRYRCDPALQSAQKRPTKS
jgi:hypothetical protein